MRKEKEKTNRIPAPLLERERGKIHPGVVENIDERDREADCFVISYKHYKDRLCGCREYRRGHLRKVLEILREIGKLGCMKEFWAAGIKISAVTNAGKEYGKLFEGLPKDADVWEHKIGQKETMFFWVLDVMSTFYLLCLTNRHLKY